MFAVALICLCSFPVCFAHLPKFSTATNNFARNSSHKNVSVKDKNLANPLIPLPSSSVVPKPSVLYTNANLNSLKGSQIQQKIISLLNKTDPNTRFSHLTMTAGQLACGQVFLAMDNDLNQIVVIKKMTINEENNEGILNELTVLDRCKNKNLVRFIGAYMVNEQTELKVWFVMEHMTGGKLTTIVTHLNLDNSGMKEIQIATICQQILLGLKYLHDSGIIHRDLKSPNVLLSLEDGSVKLCDYGSSVSSRQENKDRIGTPYWMAPEVIQGINYNTKADIWSMGIIVLELINGNTTHAEKTAENLIVMNDTLNLPSNTKASHQLQNFVHLCLNKDPNKRPSADDLLNHPFLWIVKSSAKRTSILIPLIKAPTPAPSVVPLKAGQTIVAQAPNLLHPTTSAQAVK